MKSEISLSENEKAAKEFVLRVMFKGLLPTEPCDVSITEETFKLPAFYDDEKFKRGQRYFADNRAGIMLSNLYGLFSLICEPAGAKLLDKTEHSSTPDTAKKRYISTTLHMLSWYTDELKPGSKSWESLKRVRKMHLAASNASQGRGYSVIPQCAMSMTAFGFMGYALVKPHQLGIRHDCEEDQEAFVHVWAVISSMLGVKDEFNMCLFPLGVVKTICHIFIRYAFIPFLQMETPTFEKLGRAFIDGMNYYVPFSTYESRLFLARRLAGVPGYQYDVDVSKEHHQRQIFSRQELEELKEKFQNVVGFEYRQNMVFDEKMHLIDIKRFEKCQENEKRFSEYEDYNSNTFGLYKDSFVESDNERNESVNYMLEFFGLDHPSELLITEVDDETYSSYVNDNKFMLLSRKDQFLVKYAIHHVRLLSNRFIKPFYEVGLGTLLYAMKRQSGQ